MIATLEPGRRLRRLVTIDGAAYVLELTTTAVLLRRPRHRVPVAVFPLAEVLERGNAYVVAALGRRARMAMKRRRSSARAPKRRRKASTRRTR